ncbi:MAG: hypothetical protein A3I66_01455 [Burkholderiales bacterium RIFCSPLOWO2_02_FULL_57_36]|nr:MAG: hypothetical protein A3I66_01455 [Burkholderiales bacterium RIFCSPLOWO2_02_FULL_57_36]
MADTFLFLGDFLFEEQEIPERIPLGGAQALVIHRFPGGAKVVQAMGRDDAPIAWSGLFTGGNSLERARYLDLMRVRGKSVRLTFFEFDYNVVIRSFIFTVERFYRVSYTIELEVVQDNTQPQTSFPPVAFNPAVAEDLATALALGGEIEDDTLSGLLSTMDNAITAVSDFAKTTQETINGVLAPVSAVMQRVDTMIGTVANTINSVTTMGGVLPNNPIAQQASGLIEQVTAFSQSSKLYQLRSVASRIQTNLNLIGAGPNVRTVTVGGGTLFDVAAREYGDPSLWSAIAQANKLTETTISSITNLIIPNNPQSNGGVIPQ